MSNNIFQVIALDDDFIVDSDDNMGESTDNLGTMNDNLGAMNENLGDNNDFEDNDDSLEDNNNNNLEDDIDPNDLCDQSINDPRLVCEVGLGEES